MISFLILILILILIIYSSFIFKKLINPLSIYVLFWGFMTILNIINIVGLTPPDYFAWLLFFLSFLSIFLGFVLGNKITINKSMHYQLDILKTKKIIFYFIVVSSIAIVFNWYKLLEFYGSFANFFVHMNEIYSQRVGGLKLPNIPYLSSFSLVASLFTSVLFYKNRCVWCLFSIVLVALDSLYNIGRAEFFIVLLFFLNIFLLKTNYMSIYKKLKMFFISFLMISLFLFLTNMIRDGRGGLENYNMPNNQIIHFLYNIGIYRPSLYVYIAVSPSVFSKAINDENQNSLPLNNFLFPITKKIYTLFGYKQDQYQPMYDVGIREANTATFLEAIYWDFGIVGVSVFSFLLGFISSIFYKRFLIFNSLYDLVVLNLILTYIEMGIFVNLLRTGYFFITVIVTSLLMAYLKKNKGLK